MIILYDEHPDVSDLGHIFKDRDNYLSANVSRTAAAIFSMV